MEWKYVKALTNDKNIENLEQEYKIEIPEYLKHIIIKYNGGRPTKKIFDTKNSKEKVFNSLLSYNKEDRVNIYLFDKLFHRGYIPFAITVFGDVICINKNNKFVELYLHEVDSFEYVCEKVEEFFNILYD